MRLIVKGDRFQATYAASYRGIPAVVKKEFVDRSGDTDSVVLEVEEKYQDQVSRWFIEPPRKAPFPVGTLLHYAY